MKVLVRLFPPKENRRASFVATEYQLKEDTREALQGSHSTDTKKNSTITVKEFFNQVKSISYSTHKLAKGILFLSLEDTIQDGDILNAIPI